MDANIQDFDSLLAEIKYTSDYIRKDIIVRYTEKRLVKLDERLAYVVDTWYYDYMQIKE